MSVPATILVYGRDLDLLETRGWVLERAGYRTCLALKLEKVRELTAEQPVDLLLLCHSLSPEDCEEALAVTEVIWPGMKRLLMTANTFVAHSLVKEATVSAFGGPRAMIAAVETILLHESPGVEDGAGHKAK